ncbi:hypothetical protein SynNOUM97013_01529 [Synechococcus sp. NOUM97013]|nr:hypothetical protein SynNOUM97013_01529 [Synechococcus sp. NOUM97013]
MRPAVSALLVLKDTNSADGHCLIFLTVLSPPSGDKRVAVLTHGVLIHGLYWLSEVVLMNPVTGRGKKGLIPHKFECGWY